MDVTEPRAKRTKRLPFLLTNWKVFHISFHRKLEAAVTYFGDEAKKIDRDWVAVWVG